MSATTAALQQILSSSARITAELYSQRRSSICLFVPQQLREMICIMEKTPFSRQIRCIVNANLIPLYKNALESIERAAAQNNTSDMVDIAHTFCCEIEINHVFFEGLYRYLCSYQD